MTNVRMILNKIRSVSAVVTAATFMLTSVFWAGGLAAHNHSDPIEMTLGDPEAPVELIEYASLTCPACAQFHENVYPQLKSAYIDTGKVHFRFREVYFDLPGLWAGMLARCGGPDKYFAVVDLLFSTQRSWSGQPSAGDIVARLSEIGRATGLSTESIHQCFRDSEKAVKLREIWEENRQADNVRSTPTLIINGKSHSNMSFAQLSDLLDDALNE